jgi:flavin reductase (DIM6/NTAB) family NADH-FMN oxidoreductase RutF
MEPESTFNSLVGDLDYPMFIVTACAGGERSGCLIGFATQASIDPSRFLVCLSHSNRTYRISQGTDLLGVHFVPEDARDVAELFGGETGDEVDKFTRWEWTPGPAGTPVLAGCPGWFAGWVIDRIELGDHVGYLLAPFEAWRAERVTQLGLRRARQIDPGHPA